MIRVVALEEQVAGDRGARLFADGLTRCNGVSSTDETEERSV